ncbi:hypothetical protein BDV30DRAFT_206935 [Aspergillus minisclerotigenes]|uniref:Uncharacterized protein n=1 Tax=Aspergillus minisclerotigenes TaxID=656917 RepID=A0A5N6JD53_9EURO|nr:hypothetical protein BDV30DRAFT_206935 [Aspergillus minisclerotigenes]
MRLVHLEQLGLNSSHFFRCCLHLTQPFLDFSCVLRSLNPVTWNPGSVVSLGIFKFVGVDQVAVSAGEIGAY